VLKSNILYGGIGLLAGLLIGFFFANTFHQGNPSQTSTQSQQPQQQRLGSNAASAPAMPSNQQRGVETGSQPTGTAAAPNSSEPRLTADEIREAIARADAKSDDAALQRNMGMALYRYASQTQDASLLPHAARMLERAHKADPKDYDLIVQLANIFFDVGQTSDPARFGEARKYYLKALEIKPEEASVRTDLGLTYYLGKPSDPQRAIAEYRKSIKLNSRDERTLQSLASALISTGNLGEAEQRIKELQNINPQNPELPNLQAQLAQSRNAAGRE
jgi:Flp pilus assembly protein TadD